MDNECEGDMIPSADGRYTLRITTVGTGPGYIDHSRCVVARSDGAEIATVDRNYAAFPFAFVLGHPDGHDYLLCGADYQGQTLIRLDTGERWDHVPPEAAVGAGFCFADITPSPDGRTLAVDGCYWAAPYEVRLYDFTEPGLPLPLLGSHDNCNLSIKEWADADTCVVGRVVHRRISDGADCARLSVEDEEASGCYDAEGEYNPAKVRTEFEGMPYVRPSYAAAAADCKRTLEHRLKHGLPMCRSWCDEFATLLRLGGLTDPDLERYRAMQIEDAVYVEREREKTRRRIAEREAAQGSATEET